MMPTRALRAGGRYFAIAAGGIVMGFPLLYLFSASMMAESDIVHRPPHLLPPRVVWHNYVVAWDLLDVRTAVNTVVFTGGVVVVQLCIALLGGFALAKIPFTWSAGVSVIMVVPALLPGNLTLIPLYVITRELDMLGTFQGMILPIAGQCGLAVLLFRQFFVNLPDGLIEAARIDGANWLRTFFSIAVPLSKPIIAAYSSVTFLSAWNMYVWPQVVAPDRDHQVMTVALAPIANSSSTYSHVAPNEGMAAAMITVVPVLLVFLLAQRWFIKGIVGSGVD